MGTDARIYLDFAASTPVAPEVMREMEKYSGVEYGNPSGVHAEARAAKEVLETSRQSIARVLGVKQGEILFTSGGTEGNNLAISGVIRALRSKERPLSSMHIITSQIEHPSVLDAVAYLEEEGVRATYLGVDDLGRIREDELALALSEDTVLVSLMYVNNEVGTVEPLSRFAKVIRKYKEAHALSDLYFHADASQAPLFLSCNPERLGVDLLTVDAQKFYGPKGSGFLYKKSSVPLVALFSGGEQEGGMRPGTENMPAIAGMAKAFTMAAEGREDRVTKLRELRDFFIQELLKRIPGAYVNGDLKERIANNVSITIPGKDSEFLSVVLDGKGIACGSKSACLGVTGEGSYVLLALGRSGQDARSALRFSLGEETTRAELEKAVEALTESVQNF